MQEIIDSNKGVQKVERLKLAPVLQKLRSAMTQMDAWVTASHDWDDEADWSANRKTLLRRLEDWDSSLRALNRHRSALDEVFETQKAAKEETTKLWRKGRDKWRFWTTSFGVCDSLGKVAGDNLQEQQKNIRS